MLGRGYVVGWDRLGGGLSRVRKLRVAVGEFVGESGKESRRFARIFVLRDPRAVVTS